VFRRGGFAILSVSPAAKAVTGGSRRTLGVFHEAEPSAWSCFPRPGWVPGHVGSIPHESSPTILVSRQCSPQSPTHCDHPQWPHNVIAQGYHPQRSRWTTI